MLLNDQIPRLIYFVNYTKYFIRKGKIIMLSVNPFATLAETVSPIYMQSFVILMLT